MVRNISGSHGLVEDEGKKCQHLLKIILMPPIKDRKMALVTARNMKRNQNTTSFRLDLLS